jgi:predicted Zn-dependent protease
MKNVIIALIVLTTTVGCGNQFIQQQGSALLSATGFVSQSQAEAFFSVGDKLTKAASPLTEEQEYYLGRSVSALILAEYPVYKNPPLTRYVNLVGNVVASYSGKPETFSGYHFTVLDTQEINALSAPGGFVFITRGFLSKLPNEEALAAVLAHEVAHSALGHGVGAISQANITEALSIVGKEAAGHYGGQEAQLLTEAFGDSVNEVFHTLIKGGYSKSQEYAADEYAQALLVKAGYSLQGFAAVLQQLERLEATSQRGGWFDTHPAPHKRLDNLEDYLESAPPTTSGEPIRTARFLKQR